MTNSNEDIREALGCLLWLIVFLLLVIGLSTVDDIIAFLERKM